MSLDSLFIILTLQGLFLFEGYAVWDVFVPTQHVSWQTDNTVLRTCLDD